MLPKTHFLVGLIASIGLFFIFPSLSLIGLILFFLASFLIDFDHYLSFIAKQKSFNLKKAYFWFKEKRKKIRKIPRTERKNYTTGVYLFHGFEPLVLILLFGIIINNYFFYVAGGMLLHLIFDWIEKQTKSLDYPKKFSVIYDYLKYKKKIKL